MNRKTAATAAGWIAGGGVFALIAALGQGACPP
jgi:hypothetical protein